MSSWVEHRVGEVEAGRLGAPPARVVVGVDAGVDAAEEEPDVAHDRVAEERLDGGATVAETPSGRVDDVAEAYRDDARAAGRGRRRRRGRPVARRRRRRSSPWTRRTLRPRYSSPTGWSSWRTAR
jgi:hypothetical protein